MQCSCLNLSVDHSGPPQISTVHDAVRVRVEDSEGKALDRDLPDAFTLEEGANEGKFQGGRGPIWAVWQAVILLDVWFCFVFAKDLAVLSMWMTVMWTVRDFICFSDPLETP